MALSKTAACLAVLMVLLNVAAADQGRKLLLAKAVGKSTAVRGSTATAVAKANAFNSGTALAGANAAASDNSGASSTALASADGSHGSATAGSDAVAALNSGAEAAAIAGAVEGTAVAVGSAAAINGSLAYASQASEASQTTGAAAKGGIVQSVGSAQSQASNFGNAQASQAVIVRNNVQQGEFVGSNTAQQGSANVDSFASADGEGSTAVANGDVAIAANDGLSTISAATIQQAAVATKGGFAYGKLKGRVANGGTIGNNADIGLATSTDAGSYAEINTDLAAENGAGAFVDLSRADAAEGGVAIAISKSRSKGFAQAVSGSQAQAAGDLSSAISNADSTANATDPDYPSLADSLAVATGNVPNGTARASSTSVAELEGTALSTASASAGQEDSTAEAAANAANLGIWEDEAKSGVATAAATAGAYNVGGLAQANANATVVDGGYATDIIDAIDN